MSGGDSVDARDAGTVGVADVRAVVDRLRVVERHCDDGVRVDLLRALEELKAACAGAQARVTADFASSQQEAAGSAKIPVSQRGRGIAAQVGLARRDSPWRGNRHLGMATALVHEMPFTLQLLERGLLSEWRATLLVKETACLSREDRTVLDRRLCEDPATLDGLGDRAVAAKARAWAAEVDAAAVVRRARRAESDRRVSCRPAPDTMAYVSALLPVKQGVAVQTTLSRDAAALIAAGDGRSRGQIMADLLFERVTGAGAASGCAVTVNLVMSDHTLLAGGSEPAHLQGYGPVPAALAREWVGKRGGGEAVGGHETGGREAAGGRETTGAAPSAEPMMLLRRVYACPESGSLTAVESQARKFPVGLARMIDLRDRTCRTPWCDAPIRHHDHIRSWHKGGPTTLENGAGLCAACNYAKQAAGWHAATPKRRQGEVHAYDFLTPTGHRYKSAAPALPIPIPMSDVVDPMAGDLPVAYDESA
ncbi:HNH endonuclease [Rhodococcus sp. MSC1_016]|jgi:hypothetical protein|uniref:HNH endonuclease n=1 Tax=Rhodococcus sp. MSC1_016 TaxID=2909266 RepID=UPI00202DF7E9|nr:HNH endonuclease signature motif containing protein [Rhodococcus sp. MSC1_016]